MTNSHGIASSKDLSGTDTSLFITFVFPDKTMGFVWFEAKASASCLLNFAKQFVEGTQIALFSKGYPVSIRETDSIIQSLKATPDSSGARFVLDVRKISTTGR
jgi:hypothetical protein